MGLRWRLVVGLAFYFAFIFCSLPIMGDSSFLDAVSRQGESPLLILAYSGVLVAGLLPLCARLFCTEGSQRIGMGAACAAQTLCVVCILYGGSALSWPLQALLNFLLGAGGSVAVFLWGLALVKTGDEQCERALVAVLLLAGIVVLLSSLVVEGNLRYVLAVFPLVSFLCWSGCSFEHAPLRVFTQSSGGGSEQVGNLVKDAVKASLVFAIVSFAWQLLASSMGEAVEGNRCFFAIGFAASAGILWVFTRFSAGMQIESAVRWVFPIMASGLLFAALGRSAALSAACLVLAGAHAALEMIMRLQIVSCARQLERYAIQITGFGFFAISVGAVCGELFFSLFRHFEVGLGVCFAIAYTLLVLAGAFFQQHDVPSEARTAPAADLSARGERMKERYGLSNREHEVLLLLLEGRSHPYIRDTLYISKSTVDTHVRHIYRKVGVKSKQELIDVSMAE